jgi:hypothetical protein
MAFKHFRPDGKYTPTDKGLSEISKKLEQFLMDDKSMLLLFIERQFLPEIAHLLTEFGEDVWYEIGMWKALEDHNLRCFGNPLPFSKPESVKASDFPFDEYRLSHLLWNTMMIWRGMDYFSPHHPELLPLAQRLSHFMEKQFEKLPEQSSVAKFLGSPNKTGVDVKKKLVWMGTSSYLFRTLHYMYLDDHDASGLSFNERIPYIDDFLCQECTLWSGMGVLDVLAHTLPLSDDQRVEVLSWYERHASFYEIIEIGKNGMKAKNLMTDDVYEFPEEKSTLFSPFKKGMIVYGAAVPFNGKWYWSGVQRQVGRADKMDLKTIKAQFFQKSSHIVYRYDKERAAIAAKYTEDHKKAFIEYFGSDLVEFKTGLEAAKASIAKLEFQQKKLLGKKDFERQKKQFKLQGITPEQVYSPEILNNKNGTALFFNPAIGEEMTTDFFKIKKSLQKHGKGLTQAEIEHLQEFFDDSSVSKEMLERLASKYGHESFAAAFFLHKQPKYWFHYLLRKLKGKDFRNRYPNFAVVVDGEL